VVSRFIWRTPRRKCLLASEGSLPNSCNRRITKSWGWPAAGNNKVAGSGRCMTKLKIEAEAMLKIKITAVILVVIAFVSDVALCEKKGEHFVLRSDNPLHFLNRTVGDFGPYMSAGSMK